MSLISFFLLKYLDDSTLISRITDRDDPERYQCSVDRLVDWCDNTKKTEEIIFGLAPGFLTPLVTIHGTNIAQVPSYKYLGVMIDTSLAWSHHIDYLCKRVQLLCTPYADLDRLILSLFYTWVV